MLVSHPLRLFTVNTSPPSSSRPPSIPLWSPLSLLTLIEATLGICPLISPCHSLILGCTGFTPSNYSHRQPTDYRTSYPTPTLPCAILYAHHLPRILFRTRLQSAYACADCLASVVFAPASVPRERLFRLTPAVPAPVAPRHHLWSNHILPSWIRQAVPGTHVAPSHLQTAHRPARPLAAPFLIPSSPITAHCCVSQAS